MKVFDGEVILVRILSFVSLIIYSSFSYSQEQDKIDKSVLGCLQKKYEAFNVDIDAEITNYQLYLVKKGHLKDTAGLSFISVFRKIAIENDNHILLESYSQFNIIGVPKENFGNCYLDHKNQIIISNHNLKKYFEHLEGKLNNFLEPSQVANLLLDIMDEDDFNCKSLRYYFLFGLLMTSNANK